MKNIFNNYKKNIKQKEYITDRYGFITTEKITPHEDVDHKTWCNIMSGDIFEYTRFYTKNGVPLFLKYKIWNTIVRKKINDCGFTTSSTNQNYNVYMHNALQNESVRNESNPFCITKDEYETYKNKTSNYEHQIHVDVQRTFRTHELFYESYSEGQTRLFNILVAYANYNPQIGYCQGMSSFVALLLMYLPELNTFNTVNYIIKYNNLETLFDDKLSKLNLIIELQHEILELCVPRLYRKIVECADLSVFIYSWFLTLFSRFNIALSLRIFDLLLFYDFSVLLVFVPSILRCFKKRIYECDSESLIRLLTTMENEFVDVKKVIKYFREYLDMLDLKEYRKKLGIIESR